MAFLTLDSISKEFQQRKSRVRALSPFHCDITEGEFFILLGPSGSGKSTLLNIIAGLEKPSTGSIILNRQPVVDVQKRINVEPFKRNIAMVFQNYALYPHLRVRDNIAFPLTNIRPKMNRKEINKQVSDIATLLQIDELLDRKPAELSGGQRQRVAIGRAIVRKPQLFLMDEPLSNLDAQLRVVMRTHLKKLQQRLGITTVYVTHDQIEAMSLGDQIAILNKGRLQQVGPPETIYHSPANTFVASFIGSPPMNLLKGKCTMHDEKYYFTSELLSIPITKSYIDSMRIVMERDYLLGIRPEDMRIAASNDRSVRVDIDIIENIGSEYLLYVPRNDNQHIIIKSPRKPKGKCVCIHIHENDLSLFPLES